MVQANRTEQFFASEIAGLKLFRSLGIRAPEVIASGSINQETYLVLEHLEEGQGLQTNLGQLVADLHEHHQVQKQFGFHLPHPYQGGSISFANQWTPAWNELFVERRLEGLHNALIEKGRWFQKKMLSTKQFVHKSFHN